MEETMILVARGHQETVELFPNKLKIKGLNHELEIFLNKISAVLFVHASGIVPGSMEIFFSGLERMEHKFNHLSFSAEQQPEFLKIRAAIENMIYQSEK